MQLYERGKFQLDAPLAVYAPEFAEMQVYAGLDDNGQPKYEAPKGKITYATFSATPPDSMRDGSTGSSHRALPSGRSA